MARRLTSNYKILEVTPVITDSVGMPTTIPPVRWQVANEMVGIESGHYLGMPITYMYADRWHIPGSNPSSPHTISFMGKLMEGPHPDAFILRPDKRL